MIKKTLIITSLASVLSLTVGPTLAADTVQTQDKSQVQNQTQVYGSQLMTKQERMEHRAQMRAAKTDTERKRLRKEHHERMKIRAKKQGVSLPEVPPAKGANMGKGMGSGAKDGKGPGSGSGR